MFYDSMCCFRNSSKKGYRILWEITNRCNENCAFCHAKGTKDVNLEDFRTIITNISSIDIHDIIITGGEPLLNTHIFQIMDFLKKQRIDMDMCSNGTLIDRELALDLKKYLSEISISFDTDSASLYKELRGVDLLSKVYAGIDNLVCANVEVHLTCVVNRRNINDLESIINTASKLGVKSLSFLRVITSISADAERAQGLALGMHECEEVLRTINKCRDKYNISINTKRLNNNICHELCGAGKSILGITTEGQLLNCIMNRNSNTIDALHNKVTQLDIERNFLKMDTCVV